jgi:ribose 5-phosphate isomerase A
MSEIDAGKLRVARAAAALVEDGMKVGLGSGSTATLLVQVLGERVRDEGLRIVCAATSTMTADLAQSLGIPLKALDDLDVLDINIDGADEIDPRFEMVKGRGGALLREKIVVVAARRRVTIVTPEKRVERLGLTMPIPVEASDFGLSHTERHLRELGASTSIRTRPDGSRFVTDGGNATIDCRFPEGVDDAVAFDAKLKRVPGVLETGIFVGLCDLLIVGSDHRVEQFERPASVPRLQ